MTKTKRISPSIRQLRAALSDAKRKRAEWIEVFGDKPTRGLALMSQRVERLQREVCAAESRAAVREAFGS